MTAISKYLEQIKKRLSEADAANWDIGKGVVADCYSMAPSDLAKLVRVVEELAAALHEVTEDKETADIIAEDALKEADAIVGEK